MRPLAFASAGYLAALMFMSLLFLGDRWGDARYCAEPMHRIEYAFPARQIACWLEEVP